MGTREIYKGLDVDFWSPQQTLHPKPDKYGLNHYYGYDIIRQVQWYDFGYPEIPLEIRYRSFIKRLERDKGRLRGNS